MKKLTIIFAAILAFTTLPAVAKSHYNTVHNNFGSLNPEPAMQRQGMYMGIEDDRLVAENSTIANSLNYDTTAVTAPSYRYMLRVANLHNVQGKSYTAREVMSRERMQVDNPEWGLIFNKTRGSYALVTVRCGNTALRDDITDERYMLVTIIQVKGRERDTLAVKRLTRDVDLNDGLNALRVDVQPTSVQVSIGRNSLTSIIEAPLTRPQGAVNVGFYVGPAGRIAIERSVLTVDNDNHVAIDTEWTRTTLDERFEQSRDPYEGYWTYLDRDVEDKWLRLGGRYTIALVATDDGYDIIYIAGAQVKKSLWHEGMLKGRMKRTIFNDNYDAVWVDATQLPMSDDVNASIENGVILTLHFPVYNSQLRFSKVLD